MPVKNLQKTSQTRLFLIEDRANPSSRPEYQSLARPLGLSWAQGDTTPIRVPDPSQYGKFITVDSIRGAQGLPTISIESRMTRELSTFLELVRKGCSFDIQLHAGACEDPRDFNGGWEKIYILEDAIPTSYDTGELGALDQDQDAVVNETIPLTGSDWYELKRLTGAELAATAIVQAVVDVTICDSRQCGECGIPSNGCEKIFAVTMSAGGSPGLPAEVIFSADGGTTIQETTIDSGLAANEDPTGIACVGTYLVVISNESLSLHYAPTADVLAGTDTWVEVGTGFVAAKGLNAIFSMGNLVWMAGDGGYIYFSEDITAGVTAQASGSQTVQNLAAIHGADEENIVAVGASNAVLVTDNGGDTWASVTGPAIGVALTSVWMKSAQVWFVGAANGNLYYTRDAGATWTAKAFSGSGAGSVMDIHFATGAVGYMAHKTATPAGRIFRTIDGGYSWYILPEAAGFSIPANDQVTAIVACSEDPNFVVGVGLGDNAVDGFMVKFA